MMSKRTGDQFRTTRAVAGLIAFLVLFSAVMEWNICSTPALGARSDQVTGPEQQIAVSSASAAAIIDLRGADLRDVLSALAVKMGVTIILVGEDSSSIEINFKAENMKPEQALDIIIQSQGLDYLRQGNLVVVGKPGTLDKDFFNQMLLTRFDTSFVPAEKIRGLINELGVPVKNVYIDSNPNVFWIQGTAGAQQKVREIVSAVDRRENGVGMKYRSLYLTQISPRRLVELFHNAGLELKHYVILGSRLVVFDRQLFARWDEVEGLARELDVLDARQEKVFLYRLRNLTAQEAADKLKLLDFSGEGGASEDGAGGGEVKTITFNYAQFSRELLVVCPAYLEDEVRGALGSLDTAMERIKVPILTRNSHQSCNAYRDLLSKLTGVPAGSMHVSSNLGTDASPEYVLWVETTPDRVKMLKDVIKEMRSE